MGGPKGTCIVECMCRNECWIHMETLLVVKAYLEKHCTYIQAAAKQRKMVNTNNGNKKVDDVTEKVTKEGGASLDSFHARWMYGGCNQLRRRACIRMSQLSQDLVSPLRSSCTLAWNHPKVQLLLFALKYDRINKERVSYLICTNTKRRRIRFCASFENSFK